MKTVLCFLGLMSCAHAQQFDFEVYKPTDKFTGIKIIESLGQENIGIHLVKPEEPFCIFKAGDECIVRWADNALHFSRPINVTVQQKP